MFYFNASTLQITAAKHRAQQSDQRSAELAAELAVAEKKATNSAQRIVLLAEAQARYEAMEDTFMQVTEAYEENKERIRVLEQENESLQVGGSAKPA